MNGNRSPAVVPDHELLRRIGSGSYGEVWLARNSLGTLRAVKIVHRAAFNDERPYEREFAGIRKFEPISRTHEGFVDLLQVGRNDAEGYFYYVMELADGVVAADVRRLTSVNTEIGNSKSEIGSEPPRVGCYVPRTLSAEVKTRGALPLDECLHIARTLASALAELHRHGLVHRDIKPSNIIFVGDVPKLADVGLVSAAKGLGQDRSFVGTEGFIPPEGPGTPQADLYSLGIVLYVLGTGKSYRDFPEPPADLATRPDREREHWLEFSAIIHRACQTDPKQRYASAEELLADLARLSKGRSVRRSQAWQQRRRLALKLGAATAFVVAGYLGIQSLRRSSPAASNPTTESLRARGTTNQEAYIAHQMGRFYYAKQNQLQLGKAEEHFKKAIELDPNYVSAYVGLVDTYSANQYFVPSLSLPKVRALGEKLVSLAPERAEGHTALGFCKFVEWEWAESERLLRHAIRLNDEYLMAHFNLAWLLVTQCRFAEAEPELRRAEQIDPTSQEIQTAWAWLALGQRDFETAITRLRHAQDMEPSSDLPAAWLVGAYEANGDFANAITYGERNELSWGEPPDKVAVHVETLRSAVRDRGAEGYWRTKLAYRKTVRPGAVLDEVAACHARLGETDEALTLLERMVNEHHSNVIWFKFQSQWYFPNLRTEPRFQALLKRVGLEQ